MRDLKDALKIDEHALEEEWARNPDIIYRVSEHLELLISLRDEAKHNHEVVEARVDIELRGVELRHVNGGKVKTTEKMIGSNTITDPRVIKAYREYLNLAYAVGQFKALKEALQQRSYALKDLVALYLATYYGDVQVDRRSGEVRDRRADEARKAMNDERQRWREKHDQSS